MSWGRHLYASRVAIFRLGGGAWKDGAPTYGYEKISQVVDYVLGVPGEMMCRIDLQWTRPGKMQPMPTEAGNPPSRMGTLFFDPYLISDADYIRAGDYIQTISGPINGTFEIRITPEPALFINKIDHMECEIVEVAKQSTNLFPGIDAIEASS
jgi:hypothetical protein